LKQRGLRPAVLLRGYGREEKAPLALAPGQQAPISQTGEEARLILQAGDAWVGVGADRQLAWHAVARLGEIDVLLLDDGFQHWPLRRDLDIVLIDALDPFRGGVFPIGRLREPFSALRRAHAVVITRAASGRQYAGLRAEIARFTSSPVFVGFVEASLPALPPGRIGAFCGLGHPASFWQTLAQCGIEPEFRREFPDHHRYDDGEIRAMAKQADLLVTTEKDLANIESGVARECNVYAIPIRMRIEPLEPLLEAIDRCLRAKAARALR
jgi:tetraacyldisaccharide 4'-kinase